VSAEAALALPDELMGVEVVDTSGGEPVWLVGRKHLAILDLEARPADAERAHRLYFGSSPGAKST
jgi:hypothetical protein